MIKIPNFDRYYVTPEGSVYTVFKNQLVKRKTYITKNGYEIIKLAKKGKYYRKLVHRLVAEAYINSNSIGLEVNHKDGNKLNNKVENLEFVTHSENMHHAFKNKLINRNKKTLIEFDGFRFYLNSIKEASKVLGCSTAAIINCFKNNRLLFNKYKISY